MSSDTAATTEPPALLSRERIAELRRLLGNRPPFRIVIDNQDTQFVSMDDDVIAEWGYAYRPSEVPQIVNEDFGWLRDVLNAVPSLLTAAETAIEAREEAERLRGEFAEWMKHWRESDAALEAACKSRDDYQEENERLRAILSELVTLKFDVKDSDPAEYERRKPAAWNAAREALGLEATDGSV